MASTPGLKKVPLKKEDWILSDRIYFSTKANNLQILDHLEGTATTPANPSLEANLSQRRYLQEQHIKFKEKQAQAWTFVYDILVDTPLATLLAPHEDSRNYSAVWTNLISFYESNTSDNVQRNFEFKLDNLVIKDTGDLKLDFVDAINQIEQFTKILSSLPAPFTLTLNTTSKKLKLENALGRTPRFDHIIDKINSEALSLHDFITNVNSAIDNYNKTKLLRDKRPPSILESKQIHMSNEISSESHGAMNANVDNFNNLSIEELQAHKIEINKNRNRINRAINRKRNHHHT